MMDLHINSQYSDGTHTVEHILKTAAKKGIEHISILLDGTRFYSEYPVELSKTPHDLSEVCDAVHSAGGIAVYAHPPNFLGNDTAIVLDNMRKAVDTE